MLNNSTRCKSNKIKFRTVSYILTSMFRHEWTKDGLWNLCLICVTATGVNGREGVADLSCAEASNCMDGETIYRVFCVLPVMFVLSLANQAWTILHECLHTQYCPSHHWLSHLLALASKASEVQNPKQVFQLKKLGCVTVRFFSFYADHSDTFRLVRHPCPMWNVVGCIGTSTSSLESFQTHRL